MRGEVGGRPGLSGGREIGGGSQDDSWTRGEAAGNGRGIRQVAHSIVQQTRKGLFSFEKPVQPPRFSRQPYRQTFGLLISLENFERWKISPIAVYRN